MKMSLQYVRDCKSFDDLKPAIIFVCDNLQKLSWGEFTAYQRLIEIQAQKIGATLKQVNDYAVEYQDRGVK